MVASHTLKYNSDGDRSEDVEKLDQPGTAAGTLDQVSKYTYTPARQLASVTKTGADKGDNETYRYDAAGNVFEQTIGSTSATTTKSVMNYDRNRLIKTVTTVGAGSSTTMNHRYDVFGRASTIDIGSQVIERNNYDGFDRLIRQQKWNSAGVRQTLKSVKFDPFDRTSWHGVLTAGSSATVHTRFVYLGLQDEVAAEERSNDGSTYTVSKAFTHGPGGEKLALVDSPPGGTTKKHFYSVNPHGDVESLTDDTGETTGTYRYTAYGSPDKKGTLGADAIQDDPVKDADIVNPYRFNSKRFDGATGTYDMGFREYDPGLNRFLTRDNYNGALSDMALGTDPWTVNRYAFAGGNPITGIELDGHRVIDDAGSGGSSRLYCGSACSFGGSTGGDGTFRAAEYESVANYVQPWAGAMETTKQDIVEDLAPEGVTWDEYMGPGDKGAPDHVQKWLSYELQTRLCEKYKDNCADIGIEIAAAAVWIASPAGMTEFKAESAELVRSATQKILSTKTTGQILGESLSQREWRALSRNPFLADIFYGQAIHRQVAEALRDEYGERFRYKPSRGVDFYDKHNRAYVELTTGPQVGRHVLRFGSYPGAAYIAYDINMRVGIR